MQVPWFIALHFLREYRAQTALTVCVVAIGVAVMVFLSALISGLQENLIEQTLGIQAHITVRPPEEAPLPQMEEAIVLRRTQKSAKRTTSIRQWQSEVDRLRSVPGVVAIAPLAVGSAFAQRGSAHRPVVVMAANPYEMKQVIPLDKRLTAGSLELNGNEVAIGAALAEDLGVDLGDKIRIRSPEDRDTLLVVRGLFELGNDQANRRWVIVPLRAGQALLGLIGGVNQILIRVSAIFDAEDIASDIARRSDVEAKSWMEENRQLLVALRSQSSSSYTIQFFVFLAVAMGIASVLVVSVVQRTREIGILRAMGAPRRDVFLVFLIQGASIGLLGSILGCAGGASLSFVFSRAVSGPGGAALFPIVLSWQLFLLATIVSTTTGILAAVLPARIASRLDPVEAIRHA